MKEHFLFLPAGFPAKETELVHRADRFRKEFEDGLRRTVKIADSIVKEEVLNLGIPDHAQKGRDSYGIV